MSKRQDKCGVKCCMNYAVGCHPVRGVRVLQKDPEKRFCSQHLPNNQRSRLAGAARERAGRGVCTAGYGVRKKLPTCVRRQGPGRVRDCSGEPSERVRGRCRYGKSHCRETFLGGSCRPLGRVSAVVDKIRFKTGSKKTERSPAKEVSVCVDPVSSRCARREGSGRLRVYKQVAVKSVTGKCGWGRGTCRDTRPRERCRDFGEVTEVGCETFDDGVRSPMRKPKKRIVFVPLEWREYEGEPEGNCECLCGVVFRSHARGVFRPTVRGGTGTEIGLVSRKPCPSCGKTELRQCLNDLEAMEARRAQQGAR